MNLQESIRRILREEIDDYLDAISHGGHIYWDENEKLFLGKNLDRPRNLDKIQSRLVDTYPDIIFFKDGNNILIPYYINGDIISGGSYRKNQKGIVYRLWNNENGYIQYGSELKDDLDGLINEVGDQLEINGGRPYIEDNIEYDEIDEWRIEKIISYLRNKSNRYVSDWVKKIIPNERYWEHKKSINDIAEYIVSNNLWDKVKDEVMNLQESIRKILREEKLYVTPQQLVKNLPDELKKLLFKQWGAKQNPEWHPEGNTLKHILVVLKRAYHHYPDDPNMIMAALFHDLGKMDTYSINPKTNQPTAYGHEDRSTDYVEQFKDWVESFEGTDVDEIKYLVKNHMKVKPKTWDQMKDKKKEPIKSHPAFDKLMGFTDKLDGGGVDLKESIRRILREMSDDSSDKQDEENLFLQTLLLPLKRRITYEDLKWFDSRIDAYIRIGITQLGYDKFKSMVIHDLITEFVERFKIQEFSDERPERGFDYEQENSIKCFDLFYELKPYLKNKYEEKLLQGWRQKTR